VKEASNEGSFHLSPLLAAPSLAALYICPSEGQMEESKALDLHTAWPAGVKGRRKKVSSPGDGS